MTEARAGGRGRNHLLWLLAVASMLAFSVYQRLTGPTHPLRVSFSLDGRDYRGRLVRSHSTEAPARVRLPQLEAPVSALLHHRRYPTGEPFFVQPMKSEGSELVGELPLQPAAGKVEYFVTLAAASREQRVPPDGTVLLRYKDPVPLALLLPHVILMFFAVVLGVRAGLDALLLPGALGRRVAWVLALLTTGGLVFGPLVQKRAFGAYWTGWPFGSDLTDNKVLIMWLAWVVAAAAVAWRHRPRLGRVLVLAASVVMVAVYLVPHSLRGSELDYAAVDRGVDPRKAVGTGAR